MQCPDAGAASAAASARPYRLRQTEKTVTFGAAVGSVSGRTGGIQGARCEALAIVNYEILPHVNKPDAPFLDKVEHYSEGVPNDVVGLENGAPFPDDVAAYP